MELPHRQVFKPSVPQVEGGHDTVRASRVGCDGRGCSHRCHNRAVSVAHFDFQSLAACAWDGALFSDPPSATRTLIVSFTKWAAPPQLTDRGHFHKGQSDCLASLYTSRVAKAAMCQPLAQRPPNID